MTSSPQTNFHKLQKKMDGDDVLGDDGRRALDACVKVKIMCRPQVKEYDRKSALELLLGCYAGSLPNGFSTWSFFDPLTLFDDTRGNNMARMKRTYDICEIRSALRIFDQMSYVDKYPRKGHPNSNEVRQLIDKRRADVEREFKEATVDPAGRLNYSRIVAQRRVKDCFAGNFAGDEPILLEKKYNEMYNIIDIHEAVARIDSQQLLLKYPEGDGPGSDELKNLICETRINLKKEFEETTESTFATKHEYFRSEAERRVRDCFAGTFLGDTNIFFQSEMTYDIFHIKRAVDHFDTKKVIDIYPEPGQRHDEKIQNVEENRARIQTEHDKATHMTEIEHGSGFIIHDNSIITDRHVIETYLYDKKMYSIYISNGTIGELSCKVADDDVEKDLALLYCPGLNLEKSGIHPLQLSDQLLKTGMSVICFGYPVNHNGETALFVDGKVSGFKNTLYRRFPLVVLNCSLYCGNSGGPVLRRIKGELKVVAVVKARHTKEILKTTITKAMENSPKTEEAGTSVEQLVEKLHDALMGTHSPFNFCDALPGDVVAEFLVNSKNKYANYLT